MDRVLALLAQGASITTAMEQSGRSKRLYPIWCQNHEWFKNRAESIRSKSFEEQSSFAQDRLLYFGFQTPDHQQRIIDVIESAEPGSINMILIPPGAGKTTVLEDYYNLTLGRNPNWRGCVISETEDLGKKILRNVSNRMLDTSLYPAYIEKFGPFKAPDRETSKPWNAHFITHVQASSGERDYSMEVKGAGSAIYGSSFDDIILDDVQSLKTLLKTPQLLEWFRQVLYSRVMRANTTGRLFIIGTRCGPGDFYEELLKDDVVSNLVKIPAIDQHGHSYFPVRDVGEGRKLGFSEDALQKLRKVVGEEAWSRQYMQEPISQKSQTFTQHMIDQCLDRTRTITSRHDPLAPGLLRIASLDPALSGHSVFRVAGLDADKLHILDGRNEAGFSRYEQMWETIEELTIKWHPSTWIIEGNAIQGGIARSEVITSMAEKYGFAIVAHQTGKNKMDEMIGVRSMAGTFLRKEISFPYGDAEAQRNVAELITELLNWRWDVPTKLLRQDEVMALWFIHLWWHQMKSQLVSRIDRNMNIGGLPNFARYRPRAS
jgi:hypothetical protein